MASTREDKIWLGDIADILTRLYCAIDVTVNRLCSIQSITEIIADFEATYRDEVMDLITGSPTSAPLVSHCHDSHTGATML